MKVYISGVIMTAIIIFSLAWGIFSTSFTETPYKIPDLRVPIMKGLTEKNLNKQKLDTFPNIEKLIKLDKQEIQLLKQWAEEKPNKIADWALKVKQKRFSLKFLRIILHKWSLFSLENSKIWVEKLPTDKIYDELFFTIVENLSHKSWLKAINWCRSINNKTRSEKTIAYTMNFLPKNIRPEKVFDIIKSLKIKTSQVHATRNFIIQYTKINPAKAIQWIKEQKQLSSSFKSSLMHDAITQWTIMDPTDVYQYLKKQYESPLEINLLTQKSLEAYLGIIAKKDLNKAISSIAEQKDEKIRNLFRLACIKVLGSFAPQKVSLLIFEIKNSSQRNHIALNFIRILIESKPEIAAKYASLYKLIHKISILKLTRNWAIKQPKKNLLWLSQIKTHKELATATALCMKIWTQKNPQEALQFAMKLKESLTKRIAMITYCNIRGIKTIKEVINIVAAIKNKQFRSIVLAEVLTSSVAAYQPQKVMQKLSEMHLNTPYYINRVCKLWAIKKPKIASQWAMKYPDESIRGVLLKTIFFEWAKISSVEARKSLDNFSTDVKNELNTVIKLSLK